MWPKLWSTVGVFIPSLNGQLFTHILPLDKGKHFFVPVQVLSACFRRLFRHALLEAFQQGQLAFFGDLAWLSDPVAFRRWLHLASHGRWVVYAKRPLGGPAQVIEYLGRYTH